MDEPVDNSANVFILYSDEFRDVFEGGNLNSESDVEKFSYVDKLLGSYGTKVLGGGFTDLFSIFLSYLKDVSLEPSRGSHVGQFLFRYVIDRSGRGRDDESTKAVKIASICYLFLSYVDSDFVELLVSYVKNTKYSEIPRSIVFRELAKNNMWPSRDGIIRESWADDLIDKAPLILFDAVYYFYFIGRKSPQFALIVSKYIMTRHRERNMASIDNIDRWVEIHRAEFDNDHLYGVKNICSEVKKLRSVRSTLNSISKFTEESKDLSPGFSRAVYDYKSEVA